MVTLFDVSGNVAVEEIKINCLSVMSHNNVSTENE